MLTLYRRHRKTCKSAADRYYRKCRCAVWSEGTVEGTYLRQSLKTRSWERAEELKRDLENCLKSGQPEIPTIDEAVAKFLADAEHGRKLEKATVKKYRVMLDQLKAFAKERNATLESLDVDFAREFRG
jgi:integrase/recombinase XerD